MKMLQFYGGVFSTVFLVSCGGSETESANHEQTDSVEVEVVDTLPPFVSIATNYTTTDLMLPEGFSYRVIFQEGSDQVRRADGKYFPAKGLHDLAVFIPDKDSANTKGLIYISHEDKYANPDLGDGGGGTVFEIRFNEEFDRWDVAGDFHHVDFSSVGGTNRNCGGSLTPNNTVFTCEESFAWNTDYLYQKGKGHRDTSWINGRPLWQNMGYIVEVDPYERKAIRKHMKMGKYVHEDALCTADGKYVYLTDDYSPGVFFRFQTVEPFDYTDGQLQAYKQSEDGMGGEWIDLPMDTVSLINCRKEAVKRGATMIIRHEWIEEVNGKLYISETGEDNFNWNESTALGGTVSNYAKERLHVENNDYDDCYGRILEFDPSTNRLRSYLEGGVFSDSSGVFSNPDCNTSVTLGSKTYLVISEDINWYDRGRVGKEAEENRQMFNEIYFLDMSIENPTVDDLMRFCVAPKGAETTGVIFLPNGTMLMNIQHPWPGNPGVFNASSTVLIEGFRK